MNPSLSFMTIVTGYQYTCGWILEMESLSHISSEYSTAKKSLGEDELYQK